MVSASLVFEMRRHAKGTQFKEMQKTQSYFNPTDKR